jgi:site-specific DNA-methyltransferase (adenine-specific)
VHETVSIHTKKDGIINKIKVNYLEQKQFDIESIINDVKRLGSLCNNEKGITELREYLETGKVKLTERKNGHNIVCRSGLNGVCRGMYTVLAITEGLVEKSIIKLFPDHYGAGHPTQKPVRLAERLLALISDAGDTIYDPFMGSGSFGVACLNTGRKYIGSEMKEEYFEIACKRIREAAAQGRLDLEGGYAG